MPLLQKLASATQALPSSSGKKALLKLTGHQTVTAGNLGKISKNFSIMADAISDDSEGDFHDTTMPGPTPSSYFNLTQNHWNNFSK